MAEYYSCKLDSLEQLKIFPSDKVRWLDIPNDFSLIKAYYESVLNCEITESDFSSDQWKCCAMFENGEIVAFAGALFMTDRNWEIGAVSTQPKYENKGCATIVCSFIAKYILENGKQATCNTRIENHGMQKVMQKIGMVMQ